MGKKHKLSKLSDSDEEALSKLSLKDRSKAVEGQPDQTDIDNLNILFETYDKITGGKLKRHIEELRFERLANDNNNLVPIDKTDNWSFSLPADLELEVRKYWPSIWTNDAHQRWFLKHYPKFRRF